jgi:O-antigen/teichoic acid export membrane protein
LTEPATIFNVPRGTAYITAQQLVVYASSFVYYVLLVRILNLTQIGEVSLLAGAAAVFTTFTQLALPAAATRFISASVGGRDPSTIGGVARTSLQLTITIAAPALLLSVLASPWIAITVFKNSNAFSFLVVAFTASFLLDLTTLYGAYFLGLGRYAEMAYQNVLYHPISRGLGLVLAYRGLGPLGIPTGWAIGAFATLLLSIYLLKGKLPKANNFPARRLLVFSLPLFASALITLAQGWGDIALLQAILGQFSTTGAYYLVISSVSFLSILWIPVAGALYPALSSSYTGDGPRAVSEKLGVAMRLVNLTVLPAGAALAVVAPTALEAVYGPSLATGAFPFAILAITIIFLAQSLLLITTLQAIGKTKPILGITLVATIIDLAAVGLGARALGTTAGAIGRALLALGMMALAWWTLHRVLHVPLTHGLSKALVLAGLSAIPLAIVDYALVTSLHLAAVFRLPLLVILFGLCYLIVSRELSIFTDADFELLQNALPSVLKPYLGWVERLLTRDRMSRVLPVST